MQPKKKANKKWKEHLDRAAFMMLQTEGGKAFCSEAGGTWVIYGGAGNTQKSKIHQTLSGTEFSHTHANIGQSGLCPGTLYYLASAILHNSANAFRPTLGFPLSSHTPKTTQDGPWHANRFFWWHLAMKSDDSD